MKIIFLAIGVVVVITAVIMLYRPRVAQTYQVCAKDIPKLLAELTAAKSTPAFVVFIFAKAGSSNADGVLNLQFSLEDGKPGFDWVLIGAANIADQDRFAQFARSSGYTPTLKVENGVSYLRIENGDLAELCRDVVTKMYGLSDAEPLGMIAQGFKPETAGDPVGIGPALVNRKPVL